MKTASSRFRSRPSSFPERRKLLDRRAPATFPPQFSSHRRRRSCGRRKTDRGGYVDIYDRRSWTLALSVMGLSILDAGLTLLQLHKGVIREANPVMDLVLTWGGAYAFVSLKAAMTAFALAIIILHKEWALARNVALLCLCCYVLIMIYHMYLVSGLGGVSALL